MNNFSKSLKTFLGAVLAGVAIGIGGCIYLSCDIKIVGALMFTIGLYIICLNKLFLFTGKVGYLVNKDALYLLDLLIIWLGNLLGTFIVALMFSFTRISDRLQENALAICQAKDSDNLISLFILGIFCGILMYAAVNGFRSTKNPLILLLCVSVFILCGFEHCIADMFYYSMAKAWTFDSFINVIIITLGNSLGGILLPLFAKFK